MYVCILHFCNVLAAMRELGTLLLLLVVLWIPVKGNSEYECDLQLGTKERLNIHMFYPGRNALLSAGNVRIAACLAAMDINNSTSILNDYDISLNFSDTQCSPSEATWKLVQAATANDTVWHMFIGGACSLATEPITAVAGELYGLTQISYGASSPVLSDSSVYPYFFATIPSEDQSNSLRFAFMRKFNWCKVAVIYQAETIFVKTIEHFRKNYRCENDNATLSSRSFVDDPSIAVSQLKMAEDIRIILGWFYESNAAKVICKAIQAGIINGEHVWVIPSWLSDGWWRAESDCDIIEMEGSLKYIFTVDSYPGNETSDVPAESTNRTPRSFTTDYKSCTNNSTNEEGDRFKFYTYDAILAAALALDSVDRDLSSAMQDMNSTDMNLATNFTYNSSVTEMVRDAVSQLNFTGLSRQVNFQQALEGPNALYQYRRAGSGAWEQRLLAVFNNVTMEELVFLPGEGPIWGTRTGEPPRDRSLVKRVLLSEWIGVVYFFTIVTVLALVMMLGFLVFTVATCRNNAMADAAPHMVAVILVGCILLLVSSFLLSWAPTIGPAVLDRNSTDYDPYCSRKNSFTAICNIRLWMFTIGFSLSFGALFSKIWQAYRVYTNSHLKETKLSPVSFFVVIGVFLICDVIFLLTWTIVGVAVCDEDRGATTCDRSCEFLLQYKEVRKSPVDISADDTIYIHEECGITSETLPYWASVLLVYKVLIVVFGFFLAYESRNVRYKYLSDSVIASYAMFLTAGLLFVLGIASLALVIVNQTLGAYVVLMLLILAPSVSALLSLFIPRFYCLAKKYDSMLVLIRDNQGDVPQVETIEMGRHNSTVTMDTSKITLTSFTTNQDSPAAIHEDGEDDKNSTSTDSGTATADNESDRRPSVQSTGLPASHEDSKPSPTLPSPKLASSEALINELV